MLDQVSNSNWNNVPVSGQQAPQMQGQVFRNGQMPVQGLGVGGTSGMMNPPCYVPPGVNMRQGVQMQPNLQMQPNAQMQQQMMPGAAPFGGAGAGRGGGFLQLLRAINQGSNTPSGPPGSPQEKARTQSALGAVKYELSNATSQASKAEFYCSKAGYGSDKGARRSNANEARYAANNARACADRAYSRGGSIPECQSYVSQARAQANRAEAAANRASAAVNY